MCRFLSHTAEVWGEVVDIPGPPAFWDLGYRDPLSLRAHGIPLTWTELNSRTHWRNRIRLWTAVLFRTLS